MKRISRLAWRWVVTAGEGMVVDEEPKKGWDGQLQEMG